MLSGLKFVQEKLIQNPSANKYGSVTQFFELSKFRDNVPHTLLDFFISITTLEIINTTSGLNIKHCSPSLGR